MDIESDSSKKSRNHLSNSSKNSLKHSRNLIALIGQNFDYTPYRSKFELNSIGSGKSRQSRDSDLLNRFAKESSKPSSSKSLSRNASQHNIESIKKKNETGSSNSNSGTSQKSAGQIEKQSSKIQDHVLAPKIHNCVCFVAGECLSYNCNCFLSPFPCAPECCPNCLSLRSNLPHKITNMCSCKKTRCLKLYCECLSKGVYCGVMCRCELCENHEHTMTVGGKGCACQKSHCLKKYCECYANQLKCTPKCGCFDCENMLKVDNGGRAKIPQTIQEKMDIEQPDIQFEEVDFFGTRNKK